MGHASEFLSLTKSGQRPAMTTRCRPGSGCKAGAESDGLLLLFIECRDANAPANSEGAGRRQWPLCGAAYAISTHHSPNPGWLQLRNHHVFHVQVLHDEPGSVVVEQI